MRHYFERVVSEVDGNYYVPVIEFCFYVLCKNWPSFNDLPTIRKNNSLYIVASSKSFAENLWLSCGDVTSKQFSMSMEKQNVLCSK